MLKANRIVKSTNIGGILRDAKNLKFFTNKNIPLEFDNCCGINRKTIVFVNESGNPIEIQYPFVFNNKKITNKKQFSEELTKYYGLGYIVYIVSPSNAVILSASFNSSSFKKDCCLDSVLIKKFNLETYKLCDCRDSTKITKIQDLLNAIVNGHNNYIIANYNGYISLFYLKQDFLDLIEQSSNFNTFFDGNIAHFSCSGDLFNQNYNPVITTLEDCSCTAPIIVKTVGDLLNIYSNNNNSGKLSLLAFGNYFNNNYYSVIATVYLVSLSYLQSLPSNTLLINSNIGAFPSNVEFFRASLCQKNV